MPASANSRQRNLTIAQAGIGTIALLFCGMYLSKPDPFYISAAVVMSLLFSMLTAARR